MTNATLAGNLPGGDDNGIAMIIDDLTHDPSKQHLAIVMVDAYSVTRKTDDGTQRPTVRIRQIEVVDKDHHEEIVKLLNHLQETRVGALPLSGLDDEGGEGDEDDAQ